MLFALPLVPLIIGGIIAAIAAGGIVARSQTRKADRSLRGFFQPKIQFDGESIGRPRTGSGAGGPAKRGTANSKALDKYLDRGVGKNTPLMTRIAEASKDLSERTQNAG